MDVAGLVVCAALTALGVVLAAAAARRRGARAGVRLLGVALLPLGLYLSGLLRLVTRVADAATRWATGVVFSPSVWLGIALLVVAVVLLGVAGRLPSRRRTTSRRPAATGSPARPAVGGRRGRTADPLEDFDEVAQILRQRGIR